MRNELRALIAASVPPILGPYFRSVAALGGVWMVAFPIKLKWDLVELGEGRRMMVDPVLEPARARGY
jgi:hypothetical protein